MEQSVIVKKLPELISGNGQQRRNKKIGTEFIAKELFGVYDYNGKTGVFFSKGTEYRVAVYSTDGKGAMIGTPNDKKRCIQMHPGIALMSRKHCENGINQMIVYEVIPKDIPSVTTVTWEEIEKLAAKIWVITEQQS